MIPEESDGATSFADLGLRSELLEALSGLGYEEPTPIQRGGDPAAARRAPGPARAGRHRDGQDGGVRPAGAAATARGRARERAGGPGPRAHARAGRPGLAGVPPLRPRAGRTRAADLRRAADRPAAQGARARGRRRGRHAGPGAGPHRARDPAPARGHDRRARRGGRDARHGLRRRHRGDPAGDPAGASDGAVLRDAAAPHRGASRAATSSDPVRIEMGRETGQPPGVPPLVRQSAYLVARAHKPAALGRVLDVEAPTAAIVFCRTRDEVDQLTETLNGRGYRAEALHGGMSQEQRDRVMGRLRTGHGRAADRHRRRRPRSRHRAPHPRRELRRALGPGLVRAPHRPDRPGRPRRRRHHARRAARAPDAQGDRAGDEAAHQRGEGPHRRRPARAAAGDDPRHPQREPARGRRPRTLPRRWSSRSPRSSTSWRWRSPRSSSPTTPAARPPTRRRSPQIAQRTARDGKDRRDDRRTPGPARRRARARHDPAVLRRRPGFGIRPQDLVGAIAGESRLAGRDIGAIEIADRFSLVEVPEGAADEVIRALRRSTIKGRKATVRRERDATNKR